MNCLTTMYLCELVGLKKFSNATGIINLFRGFGCFLGPFLGGKFKFVEKKNNLFLLKIPGEVVKFFGKANFCFFSAFCFIIGTVLASLVSFVSLCKPAKKQDINETNETTIKTLGDSEINKNLLSNNN